MASFLELGVTPRVVESLAELGISEPTAVQEGALPPLLAGRDVLAQAPTGTGKTVAFGLPIVEAFAADAAARFLIVVPTRELGRQVADDLNAIGKATGLRAAALHGGTDVDRDAERVARAGAACLVATPGRILDLFERGDVDPANLRLVVLDEADRLLDMGFLPDAERILRRTRTRAQTAVFGATLPTEVRELAGAHLRDSLVLEVGGAPPGRQEFRMNFRAHEKPPALTALLRAERPGRVLVFTRTRRRAEELGRTLREAGLHGDVLHGEKDDFQRRHVLDLFRKGTTTTLVTTDLASRGLDIPELTHVVNYDLPANPDDYVHRIGRVGRLGSTGGPGRVFNFVEPEEKPLRLRIEGATGVTWQPHRLEPGPPAAKPPRRG